MEDTCVICFDRMDMRSFEDPRENTETCIKIECGHAYHTRCIILCLSETNRKCPNCNKEKNARQDLTREGLTKQFMREIRKDDDVKFLVKELTEIREELHETTVQLKKDIKEYFEKRKIELNFPEKRNYLTHCISKLQGTVKSLARKKGPEYVGALTHDRSYYGTTTFERNFFGKIQAYSIRRLKFPYLRLPLY